MKKVFKLGMALLIAAIVLGFGACNFDENDDGTTNSGVDFKSYDGAAAAIYIRNETNVRLVAFRSDVRNDQLLGGVPAGPGVTHGIKKAVFDTTKANEFPMVFVTEADYIKYKKKLTDAPIFTRVYVLYNSQAENEKHYTVSGILGGNQKINLIGNMNYDIEWRQNGIEGPTIGYAPKNMMSTNLFIQPGDYQLYPVFKYYNQTRNTLCTLYPTVGSGNDKGYWFEGFSARNAAITIQLDPTEALKALSETKTLGAAWLAVTNSATTGVQVRIGNVLYTDPMGYAIINTNETLIIQIDMAEVLGTFAVDRTVGDLNIGISGRTTKVKDGSGETSFTLESDYLYNVAVTGNVQSGAHTATINLTGKTKVEN